MTNNSNVIIGTWPLSGDFGAIDEFKAEELINYSISKGFTEFDTAPNYGCGKIEEILSKTIKNYQTKFKINTKCGNSRSGEKSFDTDDIKYSIDTSIDKFGTINTIFLHNPRDEVSSWTKLLRIINHYKEKNLVKFIGISLARDYYIEDSILNEFDYIQEEINLLCFENYFRIRKLSPKIMARSPLASGVLSGKLTKKTKFSSKDHRSNWLNDERLKNILVQIDQVSKITDLNIKDFAQLFVLSLSSIDSIIHGIKSHDHVNQLLESNKKNLLKKEVLNNLFKISKNNYNLDKGKKGY